MPRSRRVLWYAAMALLVAIGYILGCTTPPIGAAGAAREEYKVVESTGDRNPASWEAILNEHGKQGWKFRAIEPGYRHLIFAR